MSNSPEQVTIDDAMEDELRQGIEHGQPEVGSKPISKALILASLAIISFMAFAVVWAYVKSDELMFGPDDTAVEKTERRTREGRVEEPDLKDYSFPDQHTVAAAAPATATDATVIDQMYCPNGELIENNCGASEEEWLTLPEFARTMDEATDDIKTSVEEDLQDFKENVRIPPAEPPDTVIEEVGKSQTTATEGEVDHRDPFQVWATQQSRGRFDIAEGAFETGRGNVLSLMKPIQITHTSLANSLIGGIVLGSVTGPHTAADGVTNVLCGGDKLMGRYQRVRAADVFRMGIVWLELERTDGAVVQFNGYGADDAGQAGAGSKINRRILEKYAGAVMLTLAQDAAAAAIASQGDGNNVAVGIGGNTESIAAIALKQTIDLPPVVTTDDHEMGSILLTQRLRLPEHDCHASAML